MTPAIQDPVISSVFFDSDLNDNDTSAWTHFSSEGNFYENQNNNWTHFQNDGNAFRSNDFQKAASFSPDTAKTWALSTFDESSLDDQASALSSPLHHPACSPLEKKPLTRSDEERVQQLVLAIRKEYQDVNTEAGQQTMMSHLNKLQQQNNRRTTQRQEFYADSCFENEDRLLMEDPGSKSVATSVAANVPYPTPRKKSRQPSLTMDASTHGPLSATTSVAANRSDMYATPKMPQDVHLESSSAPKQEEDPDFDPFTILPADSIHSEDDSTRKPISFLHAPNDPDAFSDDDTLTLSLYSHEEELDRAERIHVLKESILAILNCTLCSDPMALLTGNYEGCCRNNDHEDDTVPHVSDEEVPLTVEQSIDLGRDEIHL